MIICTFGSTQYKSDIFCEKTGNGFVVETSGHQKMVVADNDGIETEVDLMVTPTKFSCSDEVEVLNVIENLRTEGYAAPEWIKDCIEMTRTFNPKIN